MEWSPFFVSLKLATVTTIVLLVIALCLSYWLKGRKSWWVKLIDLTVMLPLVLPPTVLGFYFLMLFGQNSTIGGFLNRIFDVQLVFSFWGLVLGSVIYSLPFMIEPIRKAVEEFSDDQNEVGSIMGISPIKFYISIIIPSIKSSIITGSLLTFAHTLGEFGVVLMIGGSIPEETRTVSIAIFEQVELMNYDQAGLYALILIFISVIVLTFLKRFSRVK
jgi:molybdate transport system permease protein